MAAPTYQAYNGPMVTTAAFAGVTTGTVIKTLLQIATPSTLGLRVQAWGISFDGSALAQPIKCELVQTDVPGTVTAHVAAGIQPYVNSSAPASLMSLGTVLSGYTASAEGTTTATRFADVCFVDPVNQYSYEWPLGREFELPPSKYLRVRVTAAAAVNALCWIRWEE